MEIVPAPTRTDLTADQFTLLVELGLERTSRVLELGCGDLALGSLLLAYLEPGTYAGVALDQGALDRGISRRCGVALLELKRAALLADAVLAAPPADEPWDFVLVQPEVARVLSANGSEDRLRRLVADLRPSGLCIAWPADVREELIARALSVGLEPIDSGNGGGAPTEPLILAHAGERRRRREIEVYRDVENVHELPAIFHLWSERFVLPKLEACGFRDLDDVFLRPLAKLARERDGSECRVVSLGAGNCDLELRLASALADRGLHNLRFHCLELNPYMLERGAAAAAQASLRDRFVFVETDVESWTAEGSWAACIANHSLHHFGSLESVFDQVQAALHPGGVFLTNDMIGRNGHMRWPEVLPRLEEIWDRMPRRYKYNHQLQRFEDRFSNWDCSRDGSEGIRAQDILPLLIERFHFETFIAFGNLIDPFVDRGFGHNFDPDDPGDRDFILRIAEEDEEALDAGRFKPTHMVAALHTTPVEATTVYRHWTPEFCVRRP